MRHRRNAAFVIALIPLASLAFSTRLPAQERPRDKGEAPEEQKLKGRTSAPAAADMDGAVTLARGTKVRVTGWLYFEPDPNQPDPRGTRWEIHPVTAVAAAK